MSSVTSIPMLTTSSPDGARTRSANQDEIGRVAKDFESLFASQMLKEMRKTLDPETMFGSDSGDVYGGLFDQFVGQQMAQGGGFGLAKMLRETLRHEKQTSAPPGEPEGAGPRTIGRGLR